MTRLTPLTRDASARKPLTREARLAIVLAANLALVGALIAVGVVAHSVGVWAEGADYLADAAAIGVSLLAIRLARRPPTPRRPDGYPRATRYAALVNAGWLLLLCVIVATDSIDRLVAGARAVHGLPVLIVSGVAAAVMTASALLLGGDDDARDEASAGDSRDHDALNVRAVLLDTAADAAAAVGVAGAGAIIYATGGDSWLDPAVALLIAAVVGYHAARLVAQVRASLQAG